MKAWYVVTWIQDDGQWKGASKCYATDEQSVLDYFNSKYKPYGYHLVSIVKKDN